ncbi:MAG: response regulator, partial [Janthinobacterium sp.]
MNTALSPQALVLVVDDDSMTRFLVTEALEPEGFRIEEAASGLEALAAFQRRVPDLILLDVMMPGMSGHDTCRQLKAAPLTAAIPVIFVTALNDMRDELSGFEAGAVDYITKPLSPAIVRARVRTHLSLVRIDELKETRLQIVQRLGL